MRVILMQIERAEAKVYREVRSRTSTAPRNLSVAFGLRQDAPSSSSSTTP